MTTPVRILLVDDHTLFRESLQRVLEADERFHVVAQASTWEDAIAAIGGGASCDLALIDFQLSDAQPGKNGLAVVRALRVAQPSACALLLTAGVSGAQLEEAVQTMGASVFLKTEPTSNLFEAIERTLAGEVWLSATARQLLLEQSAAPLPAPPEAAFTARELVVLRHITEGLSNKEIADQLSMSESGVKALLQRLFEKTAVRTRSQLVRYVFECGLSLP